MYIFMMRSYTRYTQTQANNNDDNNNYLFRCTQLLYYGEIKMCNNRKKEKKIQATVQLTTQTTRPTQWPSGLSGQ